MAHPNIIEIFDLGEFEENGANKPYFVMPLLPGATLESLVRSSSQRLTVDRVVEIVSQTCRGLQAAHERGLVHRDLKPSNIFVMEDDSVKIIDFGVAHIVDTRTTMSLKGTLTARPITEDRLELLEGSYVLTVTAPGYAKATVPATIEAGKTREIALELQPVKESPADWKVVWERPNEWNIERDWLVRSGGNFVLSNFPAKAGSYSFTLWRKGKSAQWVVNYRDEKKYCLFEMEAKSLSRTVVRNGRKGFTIKVPHPHENQTTYTLQVSVAGSTITHKIFDGKSWVMLDGLKLPGPDSTVGKFGMFVPGKDQVGLPHLTFKPL